MDTLDFLQAVWPTTGIYCVAEGPHPNKQGKLVPHLHGFDTIREAVDYSMSIRRQVNVWFEMHSIRAYQDGRKGRVKRGGTNELAVKCFYAELDVGEDEPGKSPKYPTQADAFKGLKAFIDETGLPWPMVVSSGYGIHIYWCLTSDMDSATWLVHAEKLRRLMEHYGLRADHQCTTDKARIFRVVGTFNRKNQNDIREVKVRLRQDGLIDTFGMIRQLDQLVAALPAVEARESSLPADTAPDDDKPSMADLGAACGAFKLMVKTRASHTELVWFVMIQLFRFVKDGLNLMHQVSAAHPDYDAAKTDAKIAPQIAKGIGAPTCAFVESKVFPGTDSPCASCWFHGKEGGSPIRAALAKGIEPDPASDEAPMPQGFNRTKQGIMHVPGGDKLPTLISNYDMRPVDIIDEPGQETKSVEWDVTFPLVGSQRVRLPISLHAEPRMMTVLAQRGLVQPLKHQKLLGDFMSSYIRSLQRHQLEMAQHNSYGYTAGHKKFVLPDEVITAEGSTRSVLSPALKAIATMLTKKGTLEGQIKTLKFYDDPRYVRQQIMVLAALASTIFYTTGHAGVIINFSGPSGSSKTTALKASNTMFGSDNYILNGSGQGTTQKARMGRVYEAGSIPVFMDEITLLPDEDLKQLVLDISQGSQRRVRDQFNREKVLEDNHQSLILIATSNNSIHDVISGGSRAGAAGSMRVWQMEGDQPDVHSRQDAEAFLAALRRDHGHMGPVFVQHVMKHQAEIEAAVTRLRDKLIERTASNPRERFWLDTIAVIVIAARIAKHLGLLSYDPEHIMNWMLDDALVQQRQVVEESYQSADQMLMAYIERSYGQILKVMVEKTLTYLAPSPVMQPSSTSGIVGRFDVNQGQLYLTVDGLRNYCLKLGLPFNRTLRTILAAGYATKIRTTLGKGLSEVPSGQVDAIVVDMRHPRIAGSEPAAVVGDQKVVQLRRA